MEHAPWIGERYGKGIDGQRLLLFGFSHYGTLDEGEDGPDLTNHVMRTWGLGGEIPFFNTLASYFGADDPAAFFPRVAFANTLPRSVGDEEEKFADGDVAALAEVGDRVRRLIVELDPDTIVVFTAKGWRQFPQYDDRVDGGWLDVPGYKPIEFGGYRRRSPGPAMAYGLRHPMMAPWRIMRASVEAIMAVPRPR